jgi:hypothetical protein
MRKPADEFTVPTIDQPDHERSDAQIRPLALFLAGLVTSLIFVGLLVWMLFDVFFATLNTSGADVRPAPIPRSDTGQPVLQVLPGRDMQMLRAREERDLNATEWIDREKRVARIPIATAMEQVASKGLPKWPAVVEQPSGGATTAPGALSPATNIQRPQSDSSRGPQ